MMRSLPRVTAGNVCQTPESTIESKGFRMFTKTRFAWLMMGMLFSGALSGAEPTPAERMQAAQAFHLRAQERTGVLVPMYVYPENIHTNAVFNRLIDLKRRYETVPFWVIVNPASGPGSQVDANYTKAIDRLYGAGCVLIGYVSTSYAKRATAEVVQDLDRWRSLYPRTQGIFFDEMIYEDNDAGVAHQVALNTAARERGFWPTVGNPGTDTPGRYFAADAADVIVIHEADQWPTEAKLRGDYFGGYSDYPPHTRAVLLHSIPKLDPLGVRMVRKYARWIYVTEDPYRLNDPLAPNPWDTLSRHMDALCEQLSRP